MTTQYSYAPTTVIASFCSSFVATKSVCFGGKCLSTLPTADWTDTSAVALRSLLLSQPMLGIGGHEDPIQQVLGHNDAQNDVSN